MRITIFFIEMCDFLCAFVVMGSDIVGITISLFFFVFWIDDVYNKNKEKKLFVWMKFYGGLFFG